MRECSFEKKYIVINMENLDEIDILVIDSEETAYRCTNDLKKNQKGIICRLYPL